MKRYISILMTVLLFAGLLAGCGADVPAPTTAPSAQTDAPTAAPSEAPESTPTPEAIPEPPAEPPLEEFLVWMTEEVIPEDGTVVGTGRISYPVYEGAQADALNRLVEMIVFDRQAEIGRSMRSARAEWELMQEYDEGVWLTSYEETEEWSSCRYTDSVSGMDCLVLACSDYSYLGGAHGFYGTTYFVTDFASGEQVRLSELLRRFGTDLESAGEAFIGVCEKLAAEEDSIDVRPDYIRDELLRDGYWYPAEDGIHVVAPIYALAPYATGEVDLVLPWEQLQELPKADSGIYERGEGGNSPALDVRCRDYGDMSMMELPVITGTDDPAAQAINDELAQLARRYYSEVAENAELWDDTEYYVAYRSYPCSTERYLNILATEETVMDGEYTVTKSLNSWVYDREYGRRMTLTEAMLMSGYHYDDFLTLLAGGLSQCSDYRLEDVAFRMLPDGRPEFYLLVWWAVEEEDTLFSYSAYTFLRIDENGGLSPCGDLYLLDPAELDTGFTTGPLVCQAMG